MHFAFTLSILLFSLTYATAATKHANPVTYRKALTELAAGDTLILEAGIYERGLPVSDCKGTPAAWITIQGPEIGTAEIRQPLPANCAELWQCAYLAIKKLTFQGTGVSGQFGISAKGGLENTIHHVLIEDCVISDFGTSQAAVGISTKTPTWNWIIRRNVVRRCGTGLYLGNSNGADPFIHGIIEHNLVHDPIGYCMEIKFQNPRPDRPDMPTKPGSTIIRHNVFIKNDTPSPDGDRPNVLVGGFPETGPGGDDLYEIYGNFFHHNPRESLLQASGRVTIHDNVFSDCPDSNAAAIRLFRHDLPVKRAHIYHNTIVTAGYGIRIADLPLESHAIVGNLIFAETPLLVSKAMTQVTANQVGNLAEASTHLRSPVTDLNKLDLSPKPGQCVSTPLDLSSFATDTAFDLDFNGMAKTNNRHRGAYASPAAPHSWRLSQTMKTP